LSKEHDISDRMIKLVQDLVGKLVVLQLLYSETGAALRRTEQSNPRLFGLLTD